jgi:hypothetical protein
MRGAVCDDTVSWLEAGYLATDRVNDAGDVGANRVGVSFRRVEYAWVDKTVVNDKCLKDEFIRNG